ncbi:MAG: hypothetical protein U0787_16785 [Polyangia bacterium]
MGNQLPRDESPAFRFAADDLAQVMAKVAKVRWRLRLQAAARGVVQGLIAAATVMLIALLLFRLELLSRFWLVRLALICPVGVLLTAVGLSLRRIDPLWVAGIIDKSHALHDRLSSAMQFAAGHTPLAPTDFAKGLAELAVHDAAQVAEKVQPSVAAPWKKPPFLPLLGVLVALNGLLLFVRFERPKLPTEKAKSTPSAAMADTLHIDPELLGPEREELLQKLAEAEQRGDHETAQLLREMLDLLQQVERGELTRQQAFERLSEIEQRVRQGTEATLAEMEKQLHRAGSELRESKLTQELGQALVKDDLDKAKAELKELADKALARAAAADKQQMAEAFERAAKAMSSRPDEKTPTDKQDGASQKDEWQAKNKSEELSQKLNELRDEKRKLEQQIEKNPNDSDARRKLDELKQAEQKLAEQLRQEQEKQKQELAQKQQQRNELEKNREELREEERRLKKKLAENPQDEETERRLKKTQRQLEQLEQKLNADGPGERQLQRLEGNQRPEYQNEARKLLSEMEREQQKFEDEIRKLKEQKKQLEEDIRRLQEQLRKNPQDKAAQKDLAQKQQQLSQVEKQLREKQEAQKQMRELQRDLQQAAERMRQSLEKMTPDQRQAMEELSREISRYQDEVRKLAKQKAGQKQNIVTLDQIKQVLRRLGKSGQGQGQGQGQKDMQDFKKRANGDGDGQTLVLGGSGQDGQTTIVLMPGQASPGTGGPGQGQGGQGNQNGQGGPGQGKEGDRPGTQHDPNFLGDVTQIESKRKLTRVYGKEGAGPSRSQTISGAAEKGFATASYRKVYGDYTAVSEEVMSKQRVPPGYRFYVKRYFQMIKPRGN